MKRQDSDPKRRRTQIRLSLEHLESRRLMAGLNVFVFADQDGTRTHDAASDSPAAHRAVYVDLDRNGRFEDGEPLAISGTDGIAKFPNLPAGEYHVGLALQNASQVQTTAVSNDSLAELVSNSPSTHLIATDDLAHVWSVSPVGQMTAVGSSDPEREPLELGGSVISLSPVTGSSAWALVDKGLTQPALMELNLEQGTVAHRAYSGLPNGQTAVGLAILGGRLAFQLESRTDSFIALANTHPNDSVVTLERGTSIGRGKILSSDDPNHLVVLSDDRTRLTTIHISAESPLVETIALSANKLESAYLSAGGDRLFAKRADGGLDVFSTRNGLETLAYLAEAGGPVVESPRDGRFVTGNVNNPNELIVWDSGSWRPLGRLMLPGNTGSLTSLVVDPYGERLIATTQSGVFTATLANPNPILVEVPAGTQTPTISIGVRVVAPPVELPGQIEMTQSLLEDSTLTIHLMGSPAMAALMSTNYLFAPLNSPQMGSLIVAPSGKIVYRPAPNVNGRDTATLRVFDGINSSTLVISLDLVSVNDPPSSFVIEPIAITEASPSGRTAGFATVFDVDSDARYLITTNDPRFLVVNGQLLRSGIGKLDYETEPFVDLEITAWDLDAQGYQLSRNVRLPIADANDGPVAVSFTTNAISENSSGSVGLVHVVDPDGSGNYEYEVSDSRFEVVNGELRLKPGKMLDYETEPQLSVTVTVTEPTAEIVGEFPITSTVRVEVIDSNDAPTAILFSSVDVLENSEGAVIGAVDVVDQDVLDQHTYHVSDSRFIIEGGYLRLREDASLSRTVETSIPMVVWASDANKKSVAETITLNVISDAPLQNPRNPLDVDNDGNVFPRDVLILINILNVSGPHVIEPADGTGEGDLREEEGFIDVNGDGAITAIDALIIINYLNSLNSGLTPEPEAPSVEQWVFSKACIPFSLGIETLDDMARLRQQRENIDAELELLVEQLSRDQTQ